mmetsp:Transcript_95751/g.270721  ORF Transcript_95751/g.270721 Transcript_95751/m.270721 type:complete len:274 (-) Transcript_95751:14-835(-)
MPSAGPAFPMAASRIFLLLRLVLPPLARAASEGGDAGALLQTMLAAKAHDPLAGAKLMLGIPEEPHGTVAGTTAFLDIPEEPHGTLAGANALLSIREDTLVGLPATKPSWLEMYEYWVTIECSVPCESFYGALSGTYGPKNHNCFYVVSGGVKGGAGLLCYQKSCVGNINIPKWVITTSDKDSPPCEGDGILAYAAGDDKGNEDFPPGGESAWKVQVTEGSYEARTLKITKTRGDMKIWWAVFWVFVALILFFGFVCGVILNWDFINEKVCCN